MTKEEWEIVIFSDETKINLFNSDGRVYVRTKPNTRYQEKNLKDTVKFGGGNEMIWGCFGVKGAGNFYIIDKIID